MPEFILTISNPKTGKSYKKIIRDTETDIFKSKKVKDTVTGDSFGFKDYEFEITGGSDKAGFPIRPDLPGFTRKKVLLTKGPCVHIKRKGMRKRKTVVGNTLSVNIKQINLKTIKQGSKPLEEIFVKIEEKKEETQEKKEDK